MCSKSFPKPFRMLTSRLSCQGSPLTYAKRFATRVRGSSRVKASHVSIAAVGCGFRKEWVDPCNNVQLEQS